MISIFVSGNLQRSRRSQISHKSQMTLRSVCSGIDNASASSIQHPVNDSSLLHRPYIVAVNKFSLTGNPRATIFSSCHNDFVAKYRGSNATPWGPGRSVGSPCFAIRTDHSKSILQEVNGRPFRFGRYKPWSGLTCRMTV